MAPPSDQDKETLRDYTTIIQKSFEELFESAHDHPVRTSPPDDSEGEINDIVLVIDESTRYIAVKFADGWYKTFDLTKI